jgi:ABC-type phosphate transport system permease subunit
MIDRSKKRNGLARKNKKQVFVTYVFHCLSFVFAWLFLFVNFVFVFLHMIPFQQNVKLKKLVEKDVKKKQGEKERHRKGKFEFFV